MHYSPGAPVLKSYDLIDWEYIGHSAPTLPFGSQYNLDGSTSSSAYVGGICASTIGYRPSNGLFYWYGCVQTAGKTFIFTAEKPEGPWTQQMSINTCYYDAGLLIDDDDTMYIAYGQTTLRVAQLTPDGLGEVRSQAIYTERSGKLIEGSRFYQINGSYYIWATKPADQQHMLKSTTGPFGSYEIRQVLDRMPGPVAGGATPHQGALVNTPDGAAWNYMTFVDAYPLGRIPVLAPISWDASGWPSVVTAAGGSWGAEYPAPVPSPAGQVSKAGPYTDVFAGQDALNPRWEWNHNPDDSAWDLTDEGLEIRTATVAQNLYLASNTLTHRTLGSKSRGWQMGTGPGVAILRDISAYIGVHKDNGVARLVFVDSLTLGQSSWKPNSQPRVGAQGPEVAGGGEGANLWLQVRADVTPAFAGSYQGQKRYVTFWYNVDGENFEQLGPDFALDNKWQFFMAYRFAVFNFASQAKGGAVVVREFTLEGEE